MQQTKDAAAVLLGPLLAILANTDLLRQFIPDPYGSILAALAGGYAAWRRMSPGDPRRTNQIPR